MGLDIRWPMGLLFLLLGAILAVYGLVSDPGIYARSLGLNVNLWWGAVLLSSGAVMIALARRARSGTGR
jgi:ABC-type Fe3+-siderophore transport system permease subunit